MDEARGAGAAPDASDDADAPHDTDPAMGWSGLEVDATQRMEPQPFPEDAGPATVAMTTEAITAGSTTQAMATKTMEAVTVAGMATADPDPTQVYAVDAMADASQPTKVLSQDPARRTKRRRRSTGVVAALVALGFAALSAAVLLGLGFGEGETGSDTPATVPSVPTTLRPTTTTAPATTAPPTTAAPESTTSTTTSTTSSTTTTTASSSTTSTTLSDGDQADEGQGSGSDDAGTGETPGGSSGSGGSDGSTGAGD